MNTGKIALVTGGSRGIGKDIVESLAKKGVNIVFTYHTNKDKAEEVLDLVRQSGVQAWAIPLDVVDLRSFDSFIQRVIATLKNDLGVDRIDYLVNNAGTAMYQPLHDATEEQADEALTIHYKAVLFLTQRLLPYLQDGAGIVNISSGLTRMTFAGSALYASAKAAVEVLTRYMAREFSDRKIRANVVAPGAIETDFGGGRTRDNKEINAHIASVTALGRAGLPSDIGGVVAFLCSPEASWINGQRIEVSGGMML